MGTVLALVQQISDVALTTAIMSLTVFGECYPDKIIHAHQRIGTPQEEQHWFFTRVSFCQQCHELLGAIQYFSTKVVAIFVNNDLLRTTPRLVTNNESVVEVA